MQLISLFSQWSDSNAIFLFVFTACYRLDSGQPFKVFVFSERVIHELTNAGFNIRSYYVEEENLSRIARGFRVGLTITDDVHKLSVSFSPKCLLMVR